MKKLKSPITNNMLRILDVLVKNVSAKSKNL